MQVVPSVNVASHAALASVYGSISTRARNSSANTSIVFHPAACSPCRPAHTPSEGRRRQTSSTRRWWRCCGGGGCLQQLLPVQLPERSRIVAGLALPQQRGLRWHPQSAGGGRRFASTANELARSCLTCLPHMSALHVCLTACAVVPSNRTKGRQQASEQRRRQGSMREEERLPRGTPAVWPRWLRPPPIAAPRAPSPHPAPPSIASAL